MMRRALVVTAMLTLGIALPLSPATADPIRITGGSAVFDEDAAVTVDIHGFQGLHAQFKNVLFTTTGPWQCRPCAPGTTPSQVGFIESIGGGGTLEFRGLSYQLGSGSADGLGNAVISFKPFADLVVPPIAGPRVILTAPFELTSTFFSFLSFPQRGDETTTLQLTGRGILTMEMIPETGVPAWRPIQTRYDFSPTPEPATLVLMASAFGILALRKQCSSQN